MTEKNFEIPPRLITPAEAADLTVPVEEFPVEPKEWAEAWHAQAREISRASKPRILTKVGKSATYRVERRGKK